MVHFNGSGEGILWRVIDVRMSTVKIAPLFSVTGQSVLKPKRVNFHEVEPADIVQLGSAYLELQHVIQDLVRLRSGEGPPAPDPGPECTCPDWWFPPDKRDKLRKLPHNYEGVLAHHNTCKKWHET